MKVVGGTLREIIQGLGCRLAVAAQERDAEPCSQDRWNYIRNTTASERP